MCFGICTAIVCSKLNILSSWWVWREIRFLIRKYLKDRLRTDFLFKIQICCGHGCALFTFVNIRKWIVQRYVNQMLFFRVVMLLKGFVTSQWVYARTQTLQYRLPLLNMYQYRLRNKWRLNIRLKTKTKQRLCCDLFHLHVTLVLYKNSPMIS